MGKKVKKEKNGKNRKQEEKNLFLACQLFSFRSVFQHFHIMCFFCSFFIIRGQLESSVAEEKRYNPRLTKDIDAFVEIMANLNLPKPKMIGKS